MPPAESPLPAESNPPGDIPDTQAFISYVSARGRYRIDAPEGWARSELDATVTFSDKFDGEGVAPLPAACTDANMKSMLANSIKRAGGAPSDIRLNPTALPAGKAIFAAYDVNSAVEPVTGRRTRLLTNAYLLKHGDRCALITLWAPLGADNVDQWRRIARSFRWQ